MRNETLLHHLNNRGRILLACMFLLLSIHTLLAQTLAVSETIVHTDYKQNNGSISLSIVSGTSPYTYQWSTSSTTASINNLSPGNYTVTVTDANDTIIKNYDLSTYAVWDSFIRMQVTTGHVVTVDGSPQDTANAGMPYGCAISANELLPDSPGSVTYEFAPDSSYDGIIGMSTYPDFNSIPDNSFLVINPNNDGNIYFLIDYETFTLSYLGSWDKTSTLRLTLAYTADSVMLYKNGNLIYSYAKTRAETMYPIILPLDAGSKVDAVACNFGDFAPLVITDEVQHCDFEQNNGSINLTATSGEGIAYHWSNSATTNQISNLSAGTYSVTVNSHNGTYIHAYDISTYAIWDTLIRMEETPERAISVDGSPVDTSNAGMPLGVAVGANELFPDSTGSVTYEFAPDSSYSGIIGMSGYPDFASIPDNSFLIINPNNDGNIYYLLDYETFTLSYLSSWDKSNILRLRLNYTADSVMVYKNGDLIYSYAKTRVGTMYPAILPLAEGSKVDVITCNFGSFAPLEITDEVHHCDFEQNNGSITLTVTSGDGISYYWSNSGTTNQITNLSAGIYTVTVNSHYGTYIHTYDISTYAIWDSLVRMEETPMHVITVDGSPADTMADDAYGFALGGNILSPDSDGAITFEFNPDSSFGGIIGMNAYPDPDSTPINTWLVVDPGIDGGIFFVIDINFYDVTYLGAWDKENTLQLKIQFVGDSAMIYKNGTLVYGYAVSRTKDMYPLIFPFLEGAKVDAVITSTIPTPHLSYQQLADTIDFDDTTDVKITSSLSGTAINWERDNDLLVFGYDSGQVDSLLKIHMINYTNEIQSVHFKVQGQKGNSKSRQLDITTYLRGNNRSNIEIIQPASYSFTPCEQAFYVDLENNTSNSQNIYVTLTFDPLLLESTPLCNILTSGITISSQGINSSTNLYEVHLSLFSIAPTLGNPKRISFTINRIKCDEIPDIQTIDPSTGNVIAPEFPIGVIVSDAGNSLITSATVTASMEYPFMTAPASISLNITSNSSPTNITALYTNNGNADYSGNINFRIDPIVCNNVTLTNFELQVEGSNGSYTSIYNASNPSFPISISSVSINSLKKIKAILSFEASDCIEPGCTTNLYMDWGCGSDLCKTRTTVLTINRSNEQPILVISRIAPNGPTQGNNEFPWDHSCMNSEEDWEYVIQNKSPLGGLVAKNVSIDLHTPTGTYTYISYNSIGYDFNDSRFSPTNVSPVLIRSDLMNEGYTTLSFSTTPTCLSVTGAPTNLIQEYHATIPQILPQEEVVFKFKTYRCCPSDVAFNTDINFNRWNLTVQGENECNHTIVANINPTTGNNYPLSTIKSSYTGGTTFAPYQWDALGVISANEYDGGHPDIALHQSYQGNNLNLAGGVTDAQNPVACGDIQTFQIVNRTFPSDANNTSDWDAELFCPSATSVNGSNSGIAGANPSGTFKIEFSSPSSVEFDMNTPPTISGSFNGTFYSWPASQWSYNASTPFALFSISTLNSAVKANSDAFRKYFVGSILQFGMKGCCCSGCNTNPTVTVKTYFNPQPNICDECYIPLNAVPIALTIRCPGCHTPGMIITSNELNRVTYGYEDENDNGLPEKGSNNSSSVPDMIPIDNTYSRFNLLNRGASIVGDYLESFAEAKFQEGGAGGFTYSQWATNWNTTLSNLYFEQKIAKSVLVGLKTDNVKVEYFLSSNSGNTPDATYTSSYISSPVPDASDPDDGWFLFHMKDSDFPGTVTFNPGDRVRIYLVYQVNSNPLTTAELIVDAFCYLMHNDISSNTTHPQQSGTIQSDQAYDNSSVTGPDAIDPDENVLFICQGYKSSHFVYPIKTYYNESWADTNRCRSSTVNIETGYYIESGFDNTFFYEYRPLLTRFYLYQPYNLPSGIITPKLDNGAYMQFNLNVPNGYIAPLENVSMYSISYARNNNLSLNPIPALISNSLYNTYINENVSGGTSSYFINYGNKVRYCPPLENSNQTPSLTGMDAYRANTTYNPPYATQMQQISHQTLGGDILRLLTIGDESFRTGIHIDLVPECENISASTSIAHEDAYATIPGINTASSDIILDNTYPFTIHAPNPNITISDLGTTPIGPGLIDWNININMPVNSSATYPVLYIPINAISAGVTLEGIVLWGSVLYPFTIYSNSGIDYYVFYLPELAGTTTIKVRIQFDTPCDINNPPSVIIPLNMTFSCQDYIDPGEATSQCGHLVTKTLSKSFDGVHLIPDIQVLATAPFTTCTSIPVIAKLNNAELGAVGNITASICLPVGITIVGTSTLQVGTNSVPVYYSNTGACSGGNFWAFDLGTNTAFTSSLFGSNGFNSLDGQLSLNFNISGDCWTAPSNAFIEFKANTYCGQELTVQTPPFNLSFKSCGPKPKIIVEKDYIDCDGFHPAILTVVPENANEEFEEAVITWSNGSHNSSIEVGQPGIYTVTISYNPLYYSGCPISASITYLLNSVTNNPKLVGSLASPALPTVSSAIAAGALYQMTGFPFNATNSAQGIIVKGTFTIDQDYTFVGNSEIICDAGAQVIIPTSKILTLDGTVPVGNTGRVHLYACDKLWKGINISNAGTLLCKHALIEDAQYAVKMSSGSNYNISDTRFLNNYIGIYASSGNVNRLGDFSTNFFTTYTDNPNDPDHIKTLKPLFSGFTTPSGLPTPTVGAKAFCGIYLEQVHYFYLGNFYDPDEANKFEGLANGIIAINSSLHISKAFFWNIQPGTYTNTSIPTGTCVYSKSGTTGSPQYLYPIAGLQMVGSGLGVNGGWHTSDGGGLYTDITGCRNGVISDGSSTIIRDYSMGFIDQKPIEIRNARNALAIVEHNHIANSGYVGISMLSNDPAAQEVVNNNTINIGPSSNNVAAIATYETLHPHYQSPQLNNNDLEMVSSYGKHGIQSFGTYGQQIKENYVHMTSHTARVGIDNLSCKKVDEYHNTVVGGSQTTSIDNFYPVAIYHELSEGRFMCDITDYTYTGVAFNGNCLQSYLVNNEFGSHTNGLHVQDGVSLNPQPINPVSDAKYGNKWIGYYTGFAAKNDHDPQWITLYMQQIYPHLDGCNAPYNPNFGNASPNFCWPVSTDFLLYDNTFNTDFHYCGDGFQPLLRHGNPSIYEKRVMQDSIEYTFYADELKWQDKWSVYKMLKENVDSITVDSTISSFISTNEIGNIGKLYQIQEFQNQLLKPSESMVNALQRKHEVLDLLAYNDSLMSIDTVGTTWSSLISEHINLLDTLAEADSLMAIQFILHDSTVHYGLDSLKAINNELESTIDPESNLIKFNTLYYNTLAKGVNEFNKTEISEIEELAFQCPLKGGDAVYMARSLYALVKDTLIDDDLLCDTMTRQNRVMYKNDEPLQIEKDQIKQNEELFYYLFPNPASDQVTVSSNQLFCVDCYLEMYDIAGKKVLSVKLPSNSSSINISTKAFSTGLYTLRISSNGKRIYNTKLSIIQ